MSRTALTAAAALLLAGCSGVRTAEKPGGEKPPARVDAIVLPKIDSLPDMARPVFLWLRAVKEKRPELLASVFSQRARKELGGLSWPEVLAHYDRLWREKFGNWRIADFYFDGALRPADQPDRGVVVVAYKPPHAKVARRTQVPVVREGGKWYVATTFLRRRSGKPTR